jgi:hypothetical protein
VSYSGILGIVGQVAAAPQYYAELEEGGANANVKVPNGPMPSPSLPFPTIRVINVPSMPKWGANCSICLILFCSDWWANNKPALKPEFERRPTREKKQLDVFAPSSWGHSKVNNGLRDVRNDCKYKILYY